MVKSAKYNAFKKAFNHFDSRPLSGENLQKFYIDDFTKRTVEQITTTIRITDRFKKMLIIGHRGCGKSTILNKVAEDLKKEYHIVSFSAGDVVNMVDVETVDILLPTYLQVLESVREDKLFDPHARYCRSTHRFRDKPFNRDDDLGFRIVRSLS